MALKYYMYGEVSFTGAGKRTAAEHKLDQRTAAVGFVADVWQGLIDAYGSWPTGYGELTKDGLPCLRFCYSTMDVTTAFSSVDEITSAWDVFSDSDSYWAFAAVTV